MDALTESYERTGKIPPALLERPDVEADISFYIQSFYFLSGFRSSGLSGPEPIAFSDTLRYARLLGYTQRSDLLFFASIMLSCDIAYREAVREKHDRQSGAKKKK